MQPSKHLSNGAMAKKTIRPFTLNMEISVSNLYMKICFSIFVSVYSLVDIAGIKAAATEIIPETFQTTIQVNLLNEQSSVLLRYYYDGKMDRQSVRIIEAQKEEALLIDNKNKTVYFLSKSNINCEESDLNLAKLELWQYILFGEKPLLKMINAFSKPLNSNPESGTETFKTNGTIRNGNFSAIFDAMFEIRESNWSTVTGWKNVPVSVSINGSMSVTDQTSFQYQYEFFNFTGSIKDMSVFKIPAGMMCEDFHSVEKFPDIGKSFHVKIERIQPIMNKLLEEEWWFQSDMLAVRHDYKPWNSDTSIFEVHDYITGVQYRIDPESGHCDIKPLTRWRDDVITDVVAANINGVHYLKMTSPNDLFQMNGIYFKKGSTMVRDIPCDIYITYRRMVVEEMAINITLEYYILSNSWQPEKKPVPIKLLVTSENGPGEIYNFISYEDVVLDFSVFDVTSCYSERAQLHFQISIPGKYDPEMRFPLMNQARKYLKDAAHISFLRVQGLALDYDSDYLYLSAILLGRNRPIELFTKLRYGCDGPPDGHTVAVNASSQEMCAQLCVDRSHNVSDHSLYCNSFYFRIFQPKGTANLCHLSPLQRVNESKTGNEDWDCFYRSVRGKHKFDISSLEAWANINANISRGGFNITFTKQKISYSASNAEINFGFLYENEEPDPPKHFYMKAELIVHEGTERPVVQDREVWYDYERKLLRIHSNFPSSMDDLSSAVMDRIYDFNSGFMYITGSKCWSRSIVDGDTEAIFYNETLRDASIMKDPKSMLHMNGKGIFSGQKRVRGILSDVFLYHLPFYTPMNHINYTNVLHRVFFKTRLPANSKKAADEDQVPVKIETNGLNRKFVMHENIFNFVILAPELRNFDISHCYPPGKTAELCVTMLATEDIPKGYQNRFLDSFQTSLAKLTQVSPLRFQVDKLASERKQQIIVRFFVLPLTKKQGKKGMVPQNKILRTIESESKSGKLSVTFQYGVKKPYRAVSSGTTRQYPLCSNIPPKVTTTEQAAVPSCPTIPTAATVTPCPTVGKETTFIQTSRTTSKKTTSLTTQVPTNPTTKPSLPPIPSTTIPKSTKNFQSLTTEPMESEDTTPEYSMNTSGKMIILGVAMISVGIMIGAILHRYLYRNKKPIEEEWLALTNQE